MVRRFQRFSTISTVELCNVDPPQKHSLSPPWEVAQDVERRAFCRQEELETRFEAGSGMIDGEMNKLRRNISKLSKKHGKTSKKETLHTRVSNLV